MISAATPPLGVCAERRGLRGNRDPPPRQCRRMLPLSVHFTSLPTAVPAVALELVPSVQSCVERNREDDHDSLDDTLGIHVETEKNDDIEHYPGHQSPRE